MVTCNGPHGEYEISVDDIGQPQPSLRPTVKTSYERFDALGVAISMLKDRARSQEQIDAIPRLESMVAEMMKI